MKHLTELLVIAGIVCCGLLLAVQCRKEPMFFNDKEPSRVILKCEKCGQNRVHYFREGDWLAKCKECGNSVDITRIPTQTESHQKDHNNQNSEQP